MSFESYFPVIHQLTEAQQEMLRQNVVTRKIAKNAVSLSAYQSGRLRALRQMCADLQ